MTTSTFPATGGFTDNTSGDVFIPEIWSDETWAAYKSNLVLAKLVRKMSMNGKKGDTIHVPAPTRGSANAKAENTAITLQNSVHTDIDITIDKHYEYSVLIEDITKTQAMDSLRRFHTDDAGYALAKQVDTDLLALGKSFGDGDGSDWVHSAVFYNDASTGITLYADDTLVGGTDVTNDAAVRAMIQKMDDADVPQDNRFWVVPPSECRILRGIDRYVSSDFVSGQPVVNGKIGNLYGVDIYVSTNCPVTETAAQNTASATDTKASIFGHKDSMVLVEQMGVRSQSQYKQEWLADLFTADTLYGVKVARPLTAFVYAVGQ